MGGVGWGMDSLKHRRKIPTSEGETFKGAAYRLRFYRGSGRVAGYYGWKGTSVGGFGTAAVVV